VQLRLSRKDEKVSRDGIVLQSQTRRAEGLSQRTDRYMSIDQCRQIGHRIIYCDRATRGPWDDLCTHDVWSARSAKSQRITITAMRQMIAADPVIVAMSSMGESVFAHAPDQ
jgi:hypothetical protein